MAAVVSLASLHASEGRYETSRDLYEDALAQARRQRGEADRWTRGLLHSLVLINTLLADGVRAQQHSIDLLAVAELVADGSCRWGIVVDGAGIGSAMAANKVPGVRAANCHDISSARNSREHNYANVLTLGSGFLGAALALQIVETWLDTDWGAERHGRRVEKITAIERSYTRAPGGKDR